MADNTKYAQLQPFSVYGGGAVAGATTVILSSFQTIDGVDLAMTDFGAIGFGTLEPGSGPQEEQICFTGVTQNANGTCTLTGVKNVLFVAPYTQTSGLSKSHAGSTTFIISNTAGFYDSFTAKADDETITGLWDFPNGGNTPTLGASYVAPTTDTQIASKKYVDLVAVYGAPDATDVTKGIAKLSVAAASPTDPIAVGDNDPRMPTTNEKAALAGTGTPSSGNKYVTLDYFVPGTMQMYAGSSAPTGYLLCDGASYLRADYAALFAVISTTYGSADGTHFNVPDMRGRTPIGVGTGTGGGASGTGLPAGGSALTAVARGTWKGEETHVLTVGELAAHTHASNPGSQLAAGGNNDFITAASVQSSGTTATTTSTGSDTPHNNIQPVMGVNFIIKT